MNLSTRRRPLAALFMSAVMIVTSLPIGASHAGMVSTKTIIEQQSPGPIAGELAETSRERIRDLLARDDVRAEMIALGIAPAEAEARLASLTEQEITDIAGRLKHLPAGEGLGTVLIVLFIVFGIAVMVDALGMMNIFPFVCPGGDCGGEAQAYYPEAAAGPATTESYGYEEQRPAYKRESFQERYVPRDQRSTSTDQYYQPQQLPPSRNYYEERYGAQRQVR